MLPGMNPRQMKQAMRQMGIQQEDMEAQQVIIRLADRELVFDNPEIMKIVMQGQETFQLAGAYDERSLDTTPDINEDDVKTVMEQAGCSEEEAQEAISEADGDLAQAILNLSQS